MINHSSDISPKDFINIYRISHSTYYLPKVEIKDYNVTIDGKTFFEIANLKHMKILEELLLVSEMIIQPVVC